MKDRSYQDWIDLHWQRSLSAEEAKQWEVFLSDHPEHASDWALDRQLLDGVHALEDIPLSNNFTSRVIRSVEHYRPDTAQVADLEQDASDSWWYRFWSQPVIRVAGMSFLVLVGFGLWQWDPSSASLVESVTTVTQAETVPTVEELENFDAIHGLAQTTSDVDWELVFAMD